MKLAALLCGVTLLGATPEDSTSKEQWLNQCKSFRRNFDWEWGNAQRRFLEIDSALPDHLKKSAAWKEMHREQENAAQQLTGLAKLLSQTEANDPSVRKVEVLAASLETMRALSRSISLVVATMEREARAAEALPRANWRAGSLRLWEMSLDRSVGLLENLDRACRNRQSYFESVLSNL